MADRKQFLGVSEVDAEVLRILKEATSRPVTNEELREQRISFAFGNSLNSKTITKESVRHASESVRLIACAE